MLSPFAKVTPSHRPRPLWFWNGPVSPDRVRSDVRRLARDCGYGGFGILPAPGMRPGFMSRGYLSCYRAAVEEAARLNLRVCLYDEFWFPSGSAGGDLKRLHPEALSRRLQRAAYDLRGGARLRAYLPDGVVLSAVARERNTGRTLDLRGHLKGRWLDFTAPPNGSWRVTVSLAAPDGRDGLVDYLCAERVERFVELTYGRYERALRPHLGTTIDTAFYDEPTLYRVASGGMWTEGINAAFEAEHRLDPEPLYPHLFEDLDSETPRIRNLFHRTRTALFSTAFVRTLARWCEARGMELTGHMDQEEVVNPVNISGDLIRIFEHQHIPGVDQVFEYGRGSAAYKLVSSAATLYGRERVMVECYGGIKSMPPDNLYREAFDLLAKGINLMVPHAVWTEPKTIVFEPELSWRTKPWAKLLPEYNACLSRLQSALTGGKLVADIGLLYPIESLRAGFAFDGMDLYTGGRTPAEADYMEVAEHLSLRLRRDFLYLHPELLDRASVRQGRLLLPGALLAEGLQTVIVPGSRVLSPRVVKLLRELARQGGKIVLTSCRPEGWPETLGRLVPRLTAQALATALAGETPDVAVSGLPASVARDAPGAGSLSNMHRRFDTHDVYFLANTTRADLRPKVSVRGGGELTVWDPRTGDSLGTVRGEGFRLELPAVSARLLVRE
jgi:hypothetical protein